jgi:hypothetical protein
MACGTPVIAYRRGSVPEIIKESVSGFIVDTIEEAVAAVGRIANLDRVKVRAEFERRFTAERMARDYVGLYRQLLSARRRTCAVELFNGQHGGWEGVRPSPRAPDGVDRGGKLQVGNSAAYVPG